MVDGLPQRNSKTELITLRKIVRQVFLSSATIAEARLWEAMCKASACTHPVKVKGKGDRKLSYLHRTLTEQYSPFSTQCGNTLHSTDNGHNVVMVHTRPSSKSALTAQASISTRPLGTAYASTSC